MAMPDDYMRYPHRHYGMDQDRYDWSMLQRRKPVQWPNGARVALWIVPTLEWFPLDMAGKPFKAPGGMVMAYPDLRHYTLRDYGNRVGIYRILDALKTRGLKASVAANAAVAARYPYLLKEVVGQGHEVIAHGLHMDRIHHGGMTEKDEKATIAQSLDVLRKGSGQKVRGWLSPARSESYATPDLLAEQGIDYLCDWVNDDMPYEFRAKSRAIHAMPLSAEIDDYAISIQFHFSEDELVHHIVDQFEMLYEEAGREGGRILSLSLHPWITGQPYRIAYLEKALDMVMRRAGVWNATGAEILDAWKAQQ